MDLSLERDSTALGSLFQQIINDMKNTSPLWEDFVAKAGKLHTCLRAAIQAIAAYLDAFQKIADAATNSRGASKEIGTALTRVCLRHKAVETRLKTFTAAIMDCLVQPLQEKIEDWKRTVATIDKEHAKEYKRCRTELKKRSSDTLRLQKKARKGQTDSIQSLMDSHMQDVTLRRAELEDVEKKSLRSAMIEERLRYCTFVHLLQPVVKEECEVMSELGHLQEAMESIAIVTKEPNVLPQASEELIHDAKATMSLYPESPSAGSGSQGGGCSNSLGSRKSSVCSISSINSSGSSNSPGHHHHPRSLSQFVTPAIRLKPGESSDSGFCSSPALTTQASTTTSQTHAVSTWPPHSQDVVDNLPPTADRPHTISTAYEKGHQRPPLTVYTFQNPETIHEAAGSGNLNVINTSGQNTPVTQKSPAGAFNRPPLPVRCSSLERPLSANSNNRNNSGNLLQRQCPSPIPAHITKELSAAHHAQQQQNQQHHQQQQQQQQQLQQLQQQQLQSPPTYVNMSELANMAALKITNQQQQQQQHHQQQPKPLMLLQQQTSIDSMSSQHSNDSIASTNTPPLQQQTQQHNIQNQQQQQQQNTQHYQTTRSHSVSSSVSSNTASSLHSHPSIESTFATPLVGQTPTTSSGSSTPQNHYSPLLTNSPSSTAAGTPSGASITSSGMTGIGFVYNVNSPTPSQSGSPSLASDVLKITESDPCTNQAQQITTPTNDEDSFPPLATTTSQETHNQTNKNSAVIDTDSPTIVENDERSRASVLQKASMFEKQAAAAASPATPNATSGPARTPIPIVDNGGIYGTHGMATRRSDEYRAPQPAVVEQQQDVDKSFEDSIQELNNLIGELDSFQREIDASKQQQQQQVSSSIGGNNNNNNKRNINNGSSNNNNSDSNIMLKSEPYAVNISGNVIENELNVEQQQPQHAQQHHHQQQQQQTYCTSSNQTNSSGCGTDISDTTSDEIAGDDNLSIAGNRQHSSNSSKHHCGSNYASDSELSRCYVSETSSLAGGVSTGIGGDGGSCSGGYENPTFAHLVSTTERTGTGTATTATITGSLSARLDDSIGDSRSLLAAADSISLASDSLCMPRHAYVDTADSDNGSAVVVIYDHQIPITPDIDYVKQNSEIVVLRTKDPQQLQLHEMRELQQLPANLGASPESPDMPGCGRPPAATATVAPAKQRLSSFRASSEQQLQLLGHASRRHEKGTENVRCSLSTCEQEQITTATATTTPMQSDTIMRRKLPPKPNLSIFNGTTANDIHLAGRSEHIQRQQPQQQQQQQLVQQTQASTPPLVLAKPLVARKSDFKADLDAKIRKQKQKLLQQEHEHNQQLQQQQQNQQQQQQQQQTHYNSNNHQQQQQHSPQSLQLNCNNTDQQTVITSAPTISLTSASSLSSASATFAPLLRNALATKQTPASNTIATYHYQFHNHEQQQQQPQHYLNHRMPIQKQINHIEYKTTTPLTVSITAAATTTTALSPLSSLSSPSLKSLTNVTQQAIKTSTSTSSLSSLTAVLSVPAPMPTPTHTPAPAPHSVSAQSSHVACSSTPVSASSSYSCANNVNAAMAMVSVAKPIVTPRPASLSGGSTRIARRASVNTAKPPPPVRRSSSVTPTPNASNTQQQHQHTNTSILVEQQQQQYTMSNSTESLPPPPPYLLDGARSTQSTPNSPPLPPTLAMPNSSLKVSETVKALAAMQHQPASPSALRRIQQNQQQQTQPQNILQLDENDYDIYFNTYDEINSSHLPQSQNLTKIHELHNGQQHYVVQQQQQDHRQLRNLHEELYVQHILPNQIDLLTLECANIPPPLPPPNPNQQQRATAAAANHSQPQTHILQQQQHAYQHYQSNHQNHHHHQQQQNIQVQQQQPIDANIYDSKPASFRTSSPGIYAQPKVVNNMSSFRTASPSPNGHAHHHHHQQQQQQQHQLPPTQPKTNPNLIAQLNARLSGKQQQHQQQHQQQPNVADSIYGNSSNMTNHEAIYMRNYGQHQQQMPSTGPQQQQQQQQQHDDYGTSTNIEKTGSIRAKTKAEFLENLNAKLAKQGMSGRAFAVRNLINSKALPDPRLCHESLMDQIKRGATLKRNQKINDRSAPKIY